MASFSPHSCPMVSGIVVIMLEVKAEVSCCTLKIKWENLGVTSDGLPGLL